MRHKKSFNHLSRKPAHRKAMLANMAASLIVHKRISTTTAKAKALKMYVEPLITKAKEDSTHSRRTVFSYLKDKNAVTELFREVGAKVMKRPGGYTRILKTGARLGDNADMCIIELVDYNENLLAAKEEKQQQKSSTRRSRRGGKKSKTTEASANNTEQKDTDAGEEVKAEQNEAEAVKTEDQATDTKEDVEAKTEPAKKEEPKAKEDKKETSEKKDEKVEAKTEEKEVKADKKKDDKKEDDKKKD